MTINPFVLPADALTDIWADPIRWQGVVHPGGDKPDTWALSLEPGVVHVRVDVEGPWCLPQVEQALREVLRYQSGINVQLCMTWTIT